MPYIENVNVEDIKKKHNADISFIGLRDDANKIGLNVCAVDGESYALNVSLVRNDAAIERFEYSLRKNILQRGALWGNGVSFGGREFTYNNTCIVFANGVLADKIAEFVLIPGDQAINNDKIAPYGILVENVLHIYHSQPRTAGTREMFRYAIDRALALLAKKKWKLKEEDADKQKAIRELVSTSAKNEAAEAKSNLDYALRTVKDTLDSLPDKERAVMKYTAQLTETMGNLGTIAKKAQEFTEYIAKHSKVESYRVRNGNIAILFHNLEMKFGTETIDLPRYEVTLNRTASSFSVTSPDLEGKDIHPHIYEDDGRPCLGNYTTVYAKLIQHSEYCQILDLLVQYLEAYNNDSPLLSWEQLKQVLGNNGYLGSEDEDGDDSVEF